METTQSMKNNKAIYKLHFDCRRMGVLLGIFVADKDEMNELIKSGKEIYFGEVLGKHSEISGPIEEGDLTLVTDDPAIVEIFVKYDMETGYNPFNYIDRE